MIVFNILIVILVSTFIHEARPACDWVGCDGEPGGTRRRNDVAPCNTILGNVYTQGFNYEAKCYKNIDLNIKPCYIDNNGVRTSDNYIYSIDIKLEDLENPDKLFNQDLNSYKGLRVRALEIEKAVNLTTIPQEIYALKYLEYLDLSDNSIRDIQITSLARLPHLEVIDLSYNKIKDLNPIPVNERSTAKMIFLKENQIKNLPVDFLYYFPNLEQLHLQFNAIESVTLADFEGTTNLQRLHLTGNKLVSIDGEGFRKLSPSLEIFVVDYNRITNIPSNDDITYSKLEELDVTQNQIHELHSFKSFPKLKSLQIQQNNVSEITKSLFESNKDLQIITFNYNPIRKIESNSFENNIKLSHVHIRSSSLSVIERFAFKVLTENVAIDLSEGQITEIVDETFAGVRGLWSLKLSSNAINKISSLAFDSIDTLKALDISHNQLKALDFKTNNLRQLKELIAHHNKIEKINKSVFENLIALEHLDMSFNNIKEMDPNALVNLKKLNYINFSSNKEFDVMETMPLKELKELEEFQLAETAITAFKNGSITYCPEDSDTSFNASYSNVKILEYNAFGDAKCLKTLVLSHNQLESFHVNPHSIKNLKELLLDNNHLKNIYSYTFDNLNSLYNLHLENNDLVYVDPNAFKNLPMLSFFYISTTVTPRPHLKLSFSANYLGIVLVENFDLDLNFRVHSLYRLYLKNCGITDMASFNPENIPRLEELNITSNDISVINRDKMKAFTNVFKLNLSNNKISEISADSFANMTHLYQLNLSGNKIASIPNDVFNNQEKFTSLSLSDNSLSAFDFKVLPPTEKLYLDNNPITTLDIDYLFNSKIGKVSVGNTVSCETLENALRKSPENFDKFVTADPLNYDVPHVHGIPCSITFV